VYCELACALQGLAQYDMAEEWTEAMERWCQTNAIGSLHGRCRVHRAEILRLRGSCNEAEGEALVACEELRSYLRRELGWPLNELGRIRLHKGDITGAEEALLAAHRAGWDPQPALALLCLAQGDVATAAASIRDAVERPLRVPSKERPPNIDMQRAPLLEAQVEIEIAAGDLGRAQSAADELELIAARFQSKALVASAVLARGRCGSLRAMPRVRNSPYQKRRDSGTRSAPRTRRRWHGSASPRPMPRPASQHRAGLERQAARTILEGIEAAPSVPPPVNMEHHDASSEQPVVSLNMFRREGYYWSVSFDRHTVRVRDLKGMRYLARLLADPGREHHVLDLVAAETGHSAQLDSSHPGNLPHSAFGDAGEILDARAKDAYRRRLTEIEDDIDQAHAIGDAERAAQADAERDFLVRELARAFGLGSRDRRAASASERARAGVTRAVRKAIARIGDHHPQLGEHLSRTICTGTYCAYHPDPRAPAGWIL
jgi:hypothetical protein